MKKIVLAIIFVSGFLTLFSQNYELKGYVCDALTKESLPAAVVVVEPGNMKIVSDKNGNFSLENLNKNNYRIEIQYMGYKNFTETVRLESDTTLHFHLQPEAFLLNEVLVNRKIQNSNTLSAISTKEINRSFFLKNNSANFAKSLSKVAGISSMDIGAGASKPVIRGLGFNRISVVDKGIVQQNQQWGADHGLDIDQYDVDNVLIHKGPMSLFHGSEAIGGVIEIRPLEIPSENMAWGDVTFLSKSNNNLLGITAMTSVKRGNLFVRGRLTSQIYADYRVPTDTVTYLTWKMPIHNRRLKNTAGREINASLSANYTSNGVSSWTHISNIYSKNGFFPGSHGIPDIKRLQPDGSHYNVELPYSTSNHFKVSNTTDVEFDASALHFDVGFQQNRRAEMSKFHTHYANQPQPKENPDLELSFLLNTVSMNSRLSLTNDSVWMKTFGISSEFQQNRVGGYSFLMPDFERYTAGLYAATSYKMSSQLMLTAGLRYDFGRVNITGFYDKTFADYLKDGGYGNQDIQFYAQRADALRKNFGAFSGAMGFIYEPNSTSSLKVNVGRSFRFPSPNELASNGVHHGAFRHEKGSTELGAETGWQLDADYSLNHSGLSLSFNPFISYFSNYIFLAPTGEWSILPHAGQIYAYQQTRALLYGAEVEIGYRLAEGLLFSTGMEYVYNQNLENGYPLPFSPPFNISTSLTYSGHGKNVFSQYSVSLENQTIFAQNRVSNNEQKTPGASLFHLLFSVNWKIGELRFFTDFRVQNLFDTPFYNHLSFYRKLNVPEPGRNIQVILKIPFNY